MEQTTNYSLKKPEYTDVADIADINDNMDTIDTTLKSLSDNKKNKQSAVSSPSASGSTLAFIDTISQNAQGVISPTKKNVSVANNVTTTDSGSVLDARQGKTLADAINRVNNRVRFTSLNSGESIKVNINHGAWIFNSAFGANVIFINGSGVRTVVFGNDTGLVYSTPVDGYVTITSEMSWGIGLGIFSDYII